MIILTQLFSVKNQNLNFRFAKEMNVDVMIDDKETVLKLF